MKNGLKKEVSSLSLSQIKANLETIANRLTGNQGVSSIKRWSREEVFIRISDSDKRVRGNK